MKLVIKLNLIKEIDELEEDEQIYMRGFISGILDENYEIISKKIKELKSKKLKNINNKK